MRPETETAADVQFDSTHMMNYNAMLSGLRDLVDNPTPRVPVLLCLDTSGSMVGDPIRELNLGVQQFLTEMKGNDLTRCSAETAVVAFNDSASCVADFGTADKLLVPEMEAEAMTQTWRCWPESARDSDRSDSTASGSASSSRG